jgi:hypothetical protein
MAPRRRAPGLRITGVLQACPRDVPEPLSTANGRHQQQPVNLKLAQGLNLRLMHENPPVMRRSREARIAVAQSGGPNEHFTTSLELFANN